MLSACQESADDLEAFDDLMRSTEAGNELSELTLGDFANDGRFKGKVVLTTLHSGKGREFDVVIIPGLVEGILPAWTWNRFTREYEAPSPRSLSISRRLFYVGFTRARHLVYLIWSKGYHHRGYPINLGASRFATEIHKRLQDS